MARSDRADAQWLESAQVHLDEGGRFSHRNGVKLLEEVRRLRGALERIRIHSADTPPELDLCRFRLERVDEIARETLSEVD